ncbi:uncharacterized protein LOC141679332 [Apium graveolens]|uniref:uncharacterized protein LOC141679332 n=1 Tax=Apium graveolens TaxID=4045 RepID=UPI003D7AF55D
MQYFKECLLNSGLEHMRTVGDTYTWTNKRLHDLIFKRLDRMVANSTWFNTFTEGSLFVKHQGIMDHNPLLFEEPMQFQEFGKPFQFFNYMIDVPGFLDLVSSAWSIQCFGSPLVQFSTKLKHTKLLLRKLNRDVGNVHSNVQSARAVLEAFQTSLSSTLDQSKILEEEELISKLNTALDQEESLLLKKARVRWLQLGDNNNSFFHQQCKVHWNRNKVLTLQDTNGNLVHGQSSCASVAVHYCSQLLGAPASSNDIDLSMVDCNTVSIEQSSILLALVTDNLIYDTIKKMKKKNKSPGPDGVNAEFFLATRHITGASLCAAVRYFFDHGSMTSGVNSTYLLDS